MSENKCRAGFTMIEMMVVLVIILILIGMVLGVSMYASDRANEAKAKAEMQKIANALDLYRGEQQPESTQFLIAHVWRDPVNKETTINFLKWPRYTYNN